MWFLYRSTQPFQWCNTSLSTALIATAYASIHMIVVYFAGPKFSPFWMLVLNLYLFHLVMIIVFPLFCLLRYRPWGSFFSFVSFFCASRVTNLWLILEGKKLQLSCTLLWVSMVKALVPRLPLLIPCGCTRGFWYVSEQYSEFWHGSIEWNRYCVIFYVSFLLLVWFYFLPCFINVISAFVGF